MSQSDEPLPEPTPRTPRAEVRRRLLAAAAKVFAERGYADSRLEDIARAAGFTKGAVYSNFGSKQELFGALLRERSDTESTAVLAEVRGGGDLGDALRGAARLVARRIVDDTERGRLGLEFAARAAREEPTREVVAALRRAQREAASRAIAEAARRGGRGPAVDPELAALILHCLTNGLSMEHLADPAAVSAETAEQALTTVLTALLAPPPRS
ncbi:TetR/AcrR family transcriptional regulator [Marinitenerispora sediminis]|uniref:TetR family transcriptional regulator n=1 Tax=Marinitenerispora sediminis TaxID=1931232 RepID=A0A368T7T4_9ACTN|nr:TetR/AcrR family transcriptional regulator [Marinitenerispora sediminis]RCV56029.1 TetR family transcriptional regulator [Marinitenerispora sediminis]RCV60241.1 TetR family transcriptional regulator [Marinitenerispora sediminis]RCV60983.1 TetR family transcriptional regulator [Marinitenerispora sediminis]